MGYESGYTDRITFSAYLHLEAAARLKNYEPINFNRCVKILVNHLRISENFAQFILRQLADNDCQWISNSAWEIRIKPLSEIETSIRRAMQ